MSSYTKGPWHRGQFMRQQKYIFDSNNVAIVECCGKLGDAKLISASPELYEACFEELRKVYQEEYAFTLQEGYETITFMDMLKKFANDDFYRLHNMAKAVLKVSDIDY